MTKSAPAPSTPTPEPSPTTDSPAGDSAPAATGKPTRRSAVLRFAWHYVEMVIAMFVGMAVLEPLWTLGFTWAGWPVLRDDVTASSLIMATNMTIGMVPWMRFRRHSWIPCAEMGAAMYLPFLAFLVPYWSGLVGGEAVLAGGHVLMMPAMLAAMLWRRDEYTGHRH